MDRLSDADVSDIAAALREVAERGIRVARHLRREIYEVRADGADESFRIVFSAEGLRVACCWPSWHF